MYKNKNFSSVIIAVAVAILLVICFISCGLIGYRMGAAQPAKQEELEEPEEPANEPLPDESKVFTENTGGRTITYTDRFGASSELEVPDWVVVYEKSAGELIKEHSDNMVAYNNAYIADEGELGTILIIVDGYVGSVDTLQGSWECDIPYSQHGGEIDCCINLYQDSPSVYPQFENIKIYCSTSDYPDIANLHKGDYLALTCVAIEGNYWPTLVLM